MNNNLSDIILNSLKSSSDITKNYYNNMSTFQKNIFDNLLSNPDKFNEYSLNDLIFDFDKNFVEYVLNIELDTYLQYCKENNIYNKKNGSTKNISLTLGDRNIEFHRPRLRCESNFDSALIPKRTRILKDLSNNILLLFSKNNSVNDIHDILLGMFQTNVSTAYISRVINEVTENVIEWRNKQLKPCYFAVNIDCTYITIRDQKYFNSHKIPVYVVIGTSLLGHKEILGIYLGNEDENKKIIDNLSNEDIAESKSFWLTVFSDLKDRGVEKILYINSDGLSGIKEAIKDEFPTTFYQRCVVHLVRDLKSYTNKNNSKEVIQDFKNIYNAGDKKLAEMNRDYFLEKYKNQKTLIKHALEYIEYIMPLFDVPVNIRRYIYTNNIVESANSKIKRGFYGRGALPNAQSALNIIYFNLSDLETKWSKQKVSNWDNIYNEIIQVHYQDIKHYL